MTQPSKCSNAPVTSPEDSPPPRPISGACKKAKTDTRKPTPKSVPQGKHVADNADYMPDSDEDIVMGDIISAKSSGKRDGPKENVNPGTAASKSSGKDPKDVGPEMFNARIESVRRASIAKEAGIAKARAVEIALQIATKDAEDAKQRTLEQQNDWLKRLEKAIPELSDDPVIRAGFFNMIFEETHIKLADADTKLQAEIRAEREMEAHIVQLEKELVSLKKEMEKLKSQDGDSRVKELMNKFRQA